MYDYAIVGGGPSGLSLAHYLSKLNKKVIIIEKDDVIGGCHHVKRIQGKFSEHGPRIYIDNYRMFQDILRDLGTDFHDLFTPYNFGMLTIGGKSSQHFSIRELLIMTWSFITLDSIDRGQTMQEYTDYYDFSPDAKLYIDQMCRLTDGAGIDRYTVFQFFQIFNQNALYGTYQPKYPNDSEGGFIKIWTDKLLDQGVRIHTNVQITGFEVRGNKVISMTTGENSKIEARNFILAIPPKAVASLIKDTGVQNAFGNFIDFARWERETRYLQYIPVTFHWNDPITLPQKWGFPDSDWGVAYIVLSDYMEFKDSKIVISAVITNNNKSSYTDRRPSECNQVELIDELFRQLKLSYPDLPEPDSKILSHNTYNGNMWELDNQGFMITRHGFMDNISEFDNLYTSGHHTGKSEYGFNSLESAIQNAQSLVNLMEPVDPKMTDNDDSILTLRYLILVLIILIIVTLFFYFI
jgi:hypothetical protein